MRDLVRREDALSAYLMGFDHESVLSLLRCEEGCPWDDVHQSINTLMDLPDEGTALRSENSRLRALVDERTALLRECEGRIASIIQMSGPGQCDSCGLPEAGDEQWEREHREHPSGPEGESFQCWCLAYCWEPNDCRSESREEAVADILNDLSRRIAATLKETT